LNKFDVNIGIVDCEILNDSTGINNFTYYRSKYDWFAMTNHGYPNNINNKQMLYPGNHCTAPWGENDVISMHLNCETHKMYISLNNNEFKLFATNISLSFKKYILAISIENIQGIAIPKPPRN